MFIRLTNGNDVMNGRPLLLNINEIVVVVEDGVDGERFVIITGKGGLSWKVQEDFNTVQHLIDLATDRK